MMKFLKYNLIALMVLSLALLASCKKDKPSGGTPDGKGFTAMTEQDGGNSKTHLDGVVVKWTAYDQIKVANYGGGSGSTMLTYELTEGAGTSRGVFYTGEDHADFFHPDYVAAYPAAKVTSISGSTVTFNLPATQTLGENSFGEGCNPMVAYSSNQTLQFKNVMGSLCFKLRGVDQIGFLRITSKTTTDKLWGTATVECKPGESDYLELNVTSSETDQHKLTLNCGNVQLNETTPTSFYIMLPPGTLADGFTLEVADKNNNVFYSHDGSIQTTVSNPTHTVQRNEIMPSSPFYLKAGAILAKYTINASGGKVYFSKGNLKYTKPTGVWSFMDHQYDRVEMTGDDVGVDYSNKDVVSLFGWGTSGYHDSSDPNNKHYDPYSTSIASYGTVEDNYNNNRYGYGPSTTINGGNLTGNNSNYDWGVKNPIQNGGDIAGQWRTLTKDEWHYLLFDRGGDGYPRYAKATVNSVPGVILFPDGYTPASVTAINTPDAESTANSYGLSSWTAMENAGCVFLPSNGWRADPYVNHLDLPNIGTVGNYWSSTYYDSQTSWGLTFNDELNAANPAIFQVADGRTRYNGFAVRLVRDIPNDIP